MDKNQPIPMTQNPKSVSPGDSRSPRLAEWRIFAMVACLSVLFSADVSATAATDSSSETAPSSPTTPGLTLPSVDTAYDAAVDFVQSWNTKKNPNGVWKYGWSDGLYGTLVLFPQASKSFMDSRQQVGWYDPAIDLGFTPCVKLNIGGEDDDGNVCYRPGAFLLHGGGKGDGKRYAHVVWTAPTGGHYSVHATFYGQQYHLNVDLHILVSSNPKPRPDGSVFIRLSDASSLPTSRISCFDAVFTENGLSKDYRGDFTVSAGDTIDFTVGQNDVSGTHPGAVGLDAVIQKL